MPYESSDSSPDCSTFNPVPSQVLGIPATQMTDLEGVSGSWFQSGSAPPVVVISAVKQQIEDHSVSPSAS